MGWSIEVGAARSAIGSARDKLSELDDVASSVSDAFGDASTAAANAPQTQDMLTTVASDPFLVSIAGMRRHVSNAADIADKVIDEYVAGDLEMASSTQARMRRVGP